MMEIEENKDKIKDFQNVKYIEKSLKPSLYLIWNFFVKFNINYEYLLIV